MALPNSRMDPTALRAAAHPSVGPPWRAPHSPVTEAQLKLALLWTEQQAGGTSRLFGLFHPRVVPRSERPPGADLITKGNGKVADNTRSVVIPALEAAPHGAREQLTAVPTSPMAPHPPRRGSRPTPLRPVGLDARTGRPPTRGRPLRLAPRGPHLDQVLVLTWPAGLAALSALVFLPHLRRRALRRVAAIYVATVAALVLTYPANRPALGFPYAAASLAGAVAVSIGAIVWGRRRAHPRPEHAITLALGMLDRALFADPFALPAPAPFERWSVAQLVYRSSRYISCTGRYISCTGRYVYHISRYIYHISRYIYHIRRYSYRPCRWSSCTRRCSDRARFETLRGSRGVVPVQSRSSSMLIAIPAIQASVTCSVVSVHRPDLLCWAVSGCDLQPGSSEGASCPWSAASHAPAM